MMEEKVIKVRFKPPKRQIVFQVKPVTKNTRIEVKEK